LPRHVPCVDGPLDLYTDVRKSRTKDCQPRVATHDQDRLVLARRALLAVALTLLLDATGSLSPVNLAADSRRCWSLVFGAAAAVFARPVLVPMWVSIRETRS
jgi:hypothetical protein